MWIATFFYICSCIKKLLNSLFEFVIVEGMNYDENGKTRDFLPKGIYRLRGSLLMTVQVIPGVEHYLSLTGPSLLIEKFPTFIITKLTCRISHKAVQEWQGNSLGFQFYWPKQKRMLT